MPERPLRLLLERDEDRAHLQPDSARLEERQPRPLEDVGLSETVLAVRKLQQQIGVGVRDHVRDYPLTVAGTEPVRLLEGG
jgi:hypothetical protein